jgi:hypothetical protein
MDTVNEKTMPSRKLDNEELRDMEIQLYRQAIEINSDDVVPEPMVQLIRWEHGVRRRPWYEIFWYGSEKKRRKKIDDILKAPMHLSSIISASHYETSCLSFSRPNSAPSSASGPLDWKRSASSPLDWKRSPNFSQPDSCPLRSF